MKKQRQLNDRISAILLIFFFVLLVAACEDDRQKPDPTVTETLNLPVTLISNARIYTFDTGRTVIESGALAISADGEILAIGDSEPMLDVFADADRIDVGGRTILPGLIDSHGHLYGLAVSFTQANLTGAKSKAEAIKRLREFESGLPESEWLLGQGWDQNDWPEQVFPDRADLDAEFPDRPVWLRRIDGHAGWGNSLALAQADRDLSGAWQPEGGFIHRDNTANPTGILIDKAMDMIDQAVPPTSPELIDAAMDLATQKLVSLGLTGVHDPGVDRSVVALYQKKIAMDALPVRVYAMADGVNETLEWLCENGPLNDPSGRLVMRSVKLYADGALGSRGAALLKQYNDDPGNEGLLFADQDTVDANVSRVLSCGLQAAVHAIGDGANRQVLDAYAMAQPHFVENPGRHRIEHAQIIDPRDIARFKELGIIAAMQPIHATSDMYWAGERLGPERLAGAYAWASLHESGAKLAFGSDFPVEEVNPMLGIYAAVTRQDLNGWPEDGWLPGERLGREAVIRAFTLDAAYAAFMENEIGSLETGKRADFIVLDRDIMQVPAAEIPEIRVEQTWVDGKQVFSR